MKFMTMSYRGLSPFLLVATPIPVVQLVYKAPVDTLYLLTLNLLCIPFLLLLTHPQALRLRLQPELLDCNTNVRASNAFFHPVLGQTTKRT